MTSFTKFYFEYTKFLDQTRFFENYEIFKFENGFHRFNILMSISFSWKLWTVFLQIEWSEYVLLRLQSLQLAPSSAALQLPSPTIAFFDNDCSFSNIKQP